MHTAYLIETLERPETLDVYSGEIGEIIEPYYCEYEPEHIMWDWCEIGGRWSGEIPGNCCQGKDIPEDVVPYGLIAFEDYGQGAGWWQVISNEPDYSADFWNDIENMSHEDALAAIRAAEKEASDAFDAAYRIIPERWYTLVDFHS